MKARCLDQMTAAERAEFDAALTTLQKVATALNLEVAVHLRPAG